MLPRQQQQLNDMLPRQQQTEEEDVAYMGLQDHYDWIKQQQALLLQQREVSRQQQRRLQNYVHLSDQNGFHGNNLRNGDNTVVANSNYVSQRQLETLFANQPNQSGSSSEYIVAIATTLETTLVTTLATDHQFPRKLSSLTEC